jgi:hypothetical protein
VRYERDGRHEVLRRRHGRLRDRERQYQTDKDRGHEKTRALVATSSSACERALRETHSVNFVLSSTLRASAWYSTVPAMESASAIVHMSRPTS